MSDLAVISSPYFFGRERVNMGCGADAILAAGLVDALARQGPRVELQSVAPTQEYRDDIGATFDLCRSLATSVSRAVAHDAVPLVLAGNCIATLGVLAGLGSAARQVGVVWLDAHADFNTPDSTVSGYLDGMALSTVAGRCWTALSGQVDGFRAVPGDQVVLVGARALDDPEHHFLAASGVSRVGGTGDLTEHEQKDLDQTMRGLAERAQGVHIHIDLDVLDPDLVAPANEFAAPGGLSSLGVVQVISGVADQVPVLSATMACYDPAGDPGGRVAQAAVEIGRSLAAVMSPGRTSTPTGSASDAGPRPPGS